MTIEQIQRHFADSLEIHAQSAEQLPAVIAAAGERLVNCLLAGGKILTCGTGQAASNALRLTSSLVDRFERERPSLPSLALCADSITLTSIANEAGFNEIFAKQIRAIGNPRDVLVAISPAGNTASIIQAIQAAHDKEMQVIALTGHDGGDLASLYSDGDVEIRVPAINNARIHEIHLLVINTLCDDIDQQLFGAM